MRIAAPAVLLALSLVACKSNKIEIRHTVEEAPRLPSSVHVADPKAGAQLVRGFHELEANAWRWTGRQFAVALETLMGAAQKGASLNLDLPAPQTTIDKLKRISLTSSIGNTDWAPETFSRSGNYTYQREVPAGLLDSDSVRDNFRGDKSFLPGGADLREIGLVVLSAALEAT